MTQFAGFDRADLAGIPVLSRRDPRFKTFRFALYARRPLDERAAARSMLPGLLLQGTERDPDRPALARRMHDLYGAAVHPSTTKVGESHSLCFVLDTVSGDHLPGRPDQLGAGLALLADLLARPRLVDGAFPAELFERERAQTANAIRTIADDKGAYAHERAIAVACAGEPMAIPEHGGLEFVQQLTSGDPEFARQDFLRHGQMWAMAMGDLPPNERLHARVADFLAALPARDEQVVPRSVEPPTRPARETVEHTELRQTKLVMVFRAPNLDDATARVGRGLFVAMFGGGPSSRLFTEVREKRSLAYYASASGDRHKGLLVVQVGLDRKSLPAARDEVLRQFELVQLGEFDDRELETARQSLLSALQSVDDSIGARLRFTAEQWLHENDRTPADVARLCAEANRADVQAGSAGIWLDHSYILTDGEDREVTS